MRTFRIILCGVMALLLLSLLSAAQEKPWTDIENCDFCKCLTQDPHLLENMAWEYHDIDNGLMVITTVAPEFRESYLKAQKAMEELAMQMASGRTDIKTCGNCDYYGRMVMAGAHFENIQSRAGFILLITSDKPEVLKMIREYGQRNREEMAKREKG